jgi:hypothetical protein
MKLQNDDVRIVFYISGQYSSKGLIELDISLVRSFYDIWESLIWPMTYKDIRVCKDRRNEEFSLVDPQSCLCLIMLFQSPLLLFYIVVLFC